jgi:hypothetical protein
MRTGSSLQWKEIFMRAMDEPDREKLGRLVREAEGAISLRHKALGHSARARKELSAMTVATAALRSIKVLLAVASPKDRMAAGKQPIIMQHSHRENIKLGPQGCVGECRQKSARKPHDVR